MRKSNESIASRLYSGIRNALYAGTISLASMLSSSYNPINAQVTRVITTESFDSEASLKQSDIRYPDEYPQGAGAGANMHWEVRDGALKGSDYEGGKGFIRFILNDKLYPVKNNMKFKVKMSKNNWNPTDTDRIGILIGDPIAGDQGTYLEIAFSHTPQGADQYNVGLRSPGWHDTYALGTCSSLNPTGDNIIELRYNNSVSFIDEEGKKITTGGNLFLNSVKIPTLKEATDWDNCPNDPNKCPINPERTRCEKINDFAYVCKVDCGPFFNCQTTCGANPDTGEILPETCEIIDPGSCEINEDGCPKIITDYLAPIQSREAYAGVFALDSIQGAGEVFSTLTVDDLLIEYDQPAGAGAGAGLENILQPHIPKVFLRGDSNKDKETDISDPIATLLYLYNGQNSVKCLDAADTNDDGKLDISDPILSLVYLFNNGPAFAPPNLGGEGMDTTIDDLKDCESDFEWP